MSPWEIRATELAEQLARERGWKPEVILPDERESADWTNWDWENYYRNYMTK
jgi:hypothetical protein